MTEHQRLYDKKEVSLILGCSTATIDKMMKSGRITFLKIGTLVRFRPNDIRPFFEGGPTPLDEISLKNERIRVRVGTSTYKRVNGQ